jgi:hypothetical protein
MRLASETPAAWRRFAALASACSVLEERERLLDGLEEAARLGLEREHDLTPGTRCSATR